MFIHLKTVREIGHGGDFGRLAPSLIPGAKGGAVTQIVLQRAAALSLLIKPALAFLVRRGGDLLFVGPMIERAAVAVVIMHLLEFPDPAFLETDRPWRGWRPSAAAS